MPQQLKPASGRPSDRLSALSFVPLLVVPLLAVGACGDNRSDARRQEQTRSAKLVLPSSITPPVHVGAISGAPGDWKLADKVATALRQRDIPASNGLRRDGNYRLGGVLSRGGSDGQQIVIRWTLLDPAGNKIGEVTQMAALPPGRTPNEDILESVADAAAESLSPIVPSSKLQTARKFDTGEPTSRPPKEADDKNRVTAVGKIGNSSPLSRNLLSRTDDRKGDRKAAGGDDGARRAGTSVTTSDKSVTAIGRMQRGSSALSRNLIRDGGATPRRGGGDTTDAGDDKVNTQATTSRRPRGPTDAGSAPRGTMTELFRRYPTSVERAAHDRSGGAGGARGDGGDSGVRGPDRPRNDGAAVRRVADNDKVIARDFTPRMDGQTADAGNKSSGAGKGAARAAGGYDWWVQIGAYQSAAEAEGQWVRMRAHAPAQLLDAAHRVVRKNLGAKGVWYRLQVGPTGGKAAALSLCRQLKAVELSCFLIAERRRGAAARPPATSPPPKANGGATTSTYKPAPVKKTETPPPEKSADPPAKGGNGISVYDWKTGQDKKADRTEPPLSTRPGLPGLTQ